MHGQHVPVVGRPVRVAVLAAVVLATGGALFWALRDARRSSDGTGTVSTYIPISHLPASPPVLAGNPAPAPSATSVAEALRASYATAPPRTKRGDGPDSTVVTVRTVEGVAVRGAAVSVVVRAERGAPVVARDSTDANGRARLEGLRSDVVYEILVVPPIEAVSVAPEKVEWRGVGSVTVVLPPAARLEGQVLDPDGRHVPGAVIAVRDVSGIHGIASTDAHGAFRIGQMRPGHLELAAQFGDASSDWLRLELSPSATSNIVLRIGTYVARLQVRGWTAEMLNRAFLTPEVGHSGSRQEIGLDDEGAGVVRLDHPESLYVLWVPAVTGTYVVYERNLALDRTLTLVSARPSLEIRGRAIEDGSGVPARISLVGPGFQVTVRAGVDGGFRLRSGTLSNVFLLADYSRDGERYEGRHAVTENGNVEIILQRKGTVR